MADGLLERVVALPGRLRFSHILVRESLYGGLGAGRRVTLHRRAADVLEELYGGDATHLAELAHHWFEAAATGDTAAAIDYAVRAADQAAASLAYEEAVRLYGMAAQLIEVSGPLDEERLGEVLLALGEAEARAGDLPDSQATMLRVAALARRTGAASQLGRAALGYGGRFILTRAGHDARLIPLLEQALAAQDDDDGLRVRLLARLACALRGHPDREHAAELSREAVEIARRLDNPRVLGYALAGRLFAYWWPETVEERLMLAREAFDVARRANDGEVVADALLGLLAAHSERCEIDDARAALATMAAQAESMRQPALDWVARAQRCLFDLAEGSFELAELAIEDERTLSHTIPRDYISSRRFQLFLLRREQGRLAEMESVVRDSAEEFLWYPLWHRALTCLLLDLGRVDEAREVFGQALERFPLPRDNEWLLGMALTSEACAALGDLAPAEDLYREYLPFADLMAAGNAEGWMGPVARYLGLLAAALGRHNEADAHFRHAEELAERMRMRPWFAHARHDRARTLLVRNGPGDRDLAASLLRQAHGAAERLGMIALQGRTGGILAELGELRPAAGDPAPSELRPRDAVAEFRREGEYWSVEFEDQAFRLRDSKGMGYLSRMLAEPGREFHALDLVQGPGQRSAHTQREDVETRAGAVAFGDAGAVLDPQAKDAYRRRVADLEEEIEDAEAMGDVARAERAASERDFIARELAAALGLGGRDRVVASASERARVNATRAIKAALARIAEQSEALGRHLDATVRTGTYCSYVPDPRAVVAWRV